MRDRRGGSSSDRYGSGSSASGGGASPGQRTRTQMLQRRAREGAAAASTPEQVHAAAAEGVSGAGGALPHLDAIQQSFGAHDVSSVSAHVGGAAASAAESIGAHAYASGDRVAFASSPDLHTAAHEAAHVVQQRAGVSLDGGVGERGDHYERHADQVADLVVSGQSAEAALGQGFGSSASAAVQRDGDPGINTDGGRITDWTLAVNAIQSLYIGTNIGIGWKRSRGVDTWFDQSAVPNPPPVWQNVLIGAVGVVVAAATGGVGAVIVAEAGTATMAVLAANTAVEAGKAAAAAGSAAACNAAIASAGGDGRIAYRDAIKDDIDRALQREWNTLQGQLQSLSSRPDGDKWPAMQALYNGAKRGAAAAQLEQYGHTVEGWMRMQSQQTGPGVDFTIGGRTVMSMYEQHMLDLPTAQGIIGSLQVASSPSASSLSDRQRAALTGALGAGWESQPITRGTNAVTTRNGVMDLNGVLQLDLTLGAPSAERPGVSGARIVNATGINDATRSYFTQSTRAVRDLQIAKRVVGSGAGSFQIGYDEGNSASITGDTQGLAWLAAYGAARAGQALTDDNRDIMQTTGLAFLNENLLGRSLSALGVTTIRS